MIARQIFRMQQIVSVAGVVQEKQEGLVCQELPMHHVQRQPPGTTINAAALARAMETPLATAWSAHALTQPVEA